MIYCLAIRNLFFFLEFVQTVDKMWEYKMKNPSFFCKHSASCVFFSLFSFLPLWLHYNLNPLCVQY